MHQPSVTSAPSAADPGFKAAFSPAEKDVTSREAPAQDTSAESTDENASPREPKVSSMSSLATEGIASLTLSSDKWDSPLAVTSALSILDDSGAPAPLKLIQDAAELEWHHTFSTWSADEPYDPVSVPSSPPPSAYTSSDSESDYQSTTSPAASPPASEGVNAYVFDTHSSIQADDGIPLVPCTGFLVGNDVSNSVLPMPTGGPTAGLPLLPLTVAPAQIWFRPLEIVPDNAMVPPVISNKPKAQHDRAGVRIPRANPLNSRAQRTPFVQFNAPEPDGPTHEQINSAKSRKSGGAKLLRASQRKLTATGAKSKNTWSNVRAMPILMDRQIQVVSFANNKALIKLIQLPAEELPAAKKKRKGARRASSTSRSRGRPKRRLSTRAKKFSRN